MSRKIPPEVCRYARGCWVKSLLMMITCSTVPTSPAATRRRSSVSPASKRRWKPTMTGTPAPVMAVRAARTRRTSRSRGFSQSAGSPAMAARRRRLIWVPFGEAMITPSTPPGAMTSSGTVVEAHPASEASARALASEALHTTASSSCPCPARLRAWSLPIRPAPNSPMRNRPVLTRVSLLAPVLVTCPTALPGCSARQQAHSAADGTFRIWAGARLGVKSTQSIRPHGHGPFSDSSPFSPRVRDRTSCLRTIS
jgi:hypothetical protein